MSKVAPRFATAETAAKLLDMKPAAFRELVGDGHLPGPRRIGDMERWDVEELCRIINGEAVEGMGDVQW